MSDRNDAARRAAKARRDKREGYGAPKTPAQTCPTCGEVVVWDEEHLPHAWRHAHDSRWCLAVGDEAPRYPVGATDRHRAQ